MAEDTKATASTSEVDGKKTEGDGSGAGTQTGTEANAQSKFTQDDMNALAAKVRDEEREKAKKAKEKEDKDRNEAKAKEQGEFQKLAEGYKAELEELKPQVEQLESYKKAVADLATAELKSLPDEVREMAPSIDSPLDVLAWLPKGKKLAEKIQGAGPKPGNGGDPRPAGNSGPNMDAEKTAARSTGRYAF